MNKTKIIPAVVIFIQLLGFIHLYLTYKNDNSHIPAAFIELNFLAAFNTVVLFIAYFFFFKPASKINWWVVSIGLSVLTILFLIITYSIMFFSKYE
ncbi:hypothetical protein [Flavobacterium hydatis]|uniref:Uncharacterized protein n=1 Tax=Flavobacterium hydatis TaxID=991 RepID=A0A085ZZ87_FLAHY|nr:hypothetical protein [Flavobacterium hydatis]KFF09751.1 hypothetical protein IW20_22435 [Flavobacterium hydatis]OXA95409.1 hypothetical protein B0A62_08860 [Flavobacterium hydatis]